MVKKIWLTGCLLMFPMVAFSISLVSGWNLMSYNGTQSIAVSDFFAARNFSSGTQDFVSVWGWDSTTKNWKIYLKTGTVQEFNTTYGTNFTALTTIDPNYGYWINATQTVTLSYTAESGNSTELTLTSPAVKSNLLLPFSYTCDGLDSTGNRGGVTPALRFSNVPSGTVSFAITMHIDKGNEVESIWVLYDIPASTTSLASFDANVAPAGTLGISHQNNQEYFPPCSREPVTNSYTITLYALSSMLGLSPNTTDYTTLKSAAEAAKIESTTVVLSNTRYNPDEDTDLQVPTSVPTTCAEKSEAFAAYSGTSVSCDNTTMTVTSTTGLPYRSELDGDKPNVGIESWIGRVPLTHNTTWKVPLVPNYLNIPTSNINIHHPIGITVDGIPILHYAKEASNDEVAQLGTDYSTRDTVLLGEIDQCGAHAGNGEDYHYHYAPLCMMDTHDPSKPIAYMFDGIPLYYGTAGGTVSGSTSVNYGAGRYDKLDYRPHAVKTNTKSLDDCNAYDLNEDGATTGYVYYTTKEAPYTIGCFRGTADQAASVANYPRWQTDRNLAWSGADVLITNYYEAEFEGKTWTFMEMTPGTGNNKLPSGNTGVILYRQLASGDTGYVSGSDCWSFRYRLDKNDTSGSNDTTETQCR